MVKYSDEERAKEIKERIEELENNENEEEYDSMLDEYNEVIKICSLEYSASFILKNVDELAYNCGHNDYNDSLLSELEDELSDLEVV